MAEIGQVKIHDRLHLEARITDVIVERKKVQVACAGNIFWIEGDDVDAIKHIPSPKPRFKRGDWVRHMQDKDLRHGLVLSGPTKEDDYIVSWSEVSRNIENSLYLEHDEAPES